MHHSHTKSKMYNIIISWTVIVFRGSTKFWQRPKIPYCLLVGFVVAVADKGLVFLCGKGELPQVHKKTTVYA